jgi:hypothetical protein
MIRYALHARSRMAERSISESQVEEALERPLEVVPTKYERRAACTQLDNGKYLVVVFEGTHEDFLVVIAIKVDKSRARRYGFTRV